VGKVRAVKKKQVLIVLIGRCRFGKQRLSPQEAAPFALVV
jgi:hypothetical protein